MVEYGTFITYNTCGNLFYYSKGVQGYLSVEVRGLSLEVGVWGFESWKVCEWKECESGEIGEDAKAGRHTYMYNVFEILK